MSTAIRTEELTKAFGSFVAVKGISFKVEKGEIFGFLGPNGAGKTTTIKMLCTLLTPTKGRAEVDGHDVVKEANKVRKKIGVVTEKLVAYDRLTPLENLTVFGRLYGMDPGRSEPGDRQPDPEKDPLYQPPLFPRRRIGSGNHRYGRRGAW